MNKTTPASSPLAARSVLRVGKGQNAEELSAVLFRNGGVKNFVKRDTVQKSEDYARWGNVESATSTGK
jgi:hypothetical protein